MTLQKPELSDLQAEAARLGKDPVRIERAYHLLRILEALQNNSKTQDKFSICGGTAFNLFRGNLPRISQDIDLRYTGHVDSEACKKDRPIVDQGIYEALHAAGFTNITAPTGRVNTWEMKYESVLGGTQSLTIDINYFNRLPLFQQKKSPSAVICGFSTSFDVLNNNDLVAGKFNALFTRPKTASRDIYDIYRILTPSLSK